MAQCIAGNVRLFLLLALLPCLAAGATAQEKTAAANASTPRVFTTDPAALRQLRETIRGGKSDAPALRELRADAERALQQPPLSVIEKAVTPPSGDKHDYMTLAPYWWPDPKSPNGLPYIRRDGEHNPELARIPDHKNFDTLMNAAHTLALAYYLFGDEKYATKSAELLRAWFLTPETRMNPNLQFAQGIGGINSGRGTGLIETRGIGKVADAAGLLAGSKAWSDADEKGLEQWCTRFLTWMLESDNGKQEAKAKNNHGTYYDVQVAVLALFTGQRDRARALLQSEGQRRIAAQVEPDGRQPLELVRTKSFSYSVMNLNGLFELARLGERVDVDLWTFQTHDGRSLRAALDYLLPYAEGERKWPAQQIEPIKGQELAPLLLEAAAHWKAPQYREAAARLDAHSGESLVAVLLAAGPGAR